MGDIFKLSTGGVLIAPFDWRTAAADNCPWRYQPLVLMQTAAYKISEFPH
jgi:hypothetical protein